jgi:D-tyrosyl-tRNA(Tyr) deacylase
MIALLQRVLEARVDVDGVTVAAVGPGLLVFLAVRPDDTEATADRLLQRLLAYRVFADAQGRMNRSVVDTAGEVLLVPQFTLAADTRKGNRPSFTGAATPAHGRRLFDHCVASAGTLLPGRIASGTFGADMKVQLVNDGPVTFWLEV